MTWLEKLTNLLYWILNRINLEILVSPHTQRRNIYIFIKKLLFNIDYTGYTNLNDSIEIDEKLDQLIKKSKTTIKNIYIKSSLLFANKDTKDFISDLYSTILQYIDWCEGLKIAKRKNDAKIISYLIKEKASCIDDLQNLHGQLDQVFSDVISYENTLVSTISPKPTKSN